MASACSRSGKPLPCAGSVAKPHCCKPRTRGRARRRPASHSWQADRGSEPAQTPQEHGEPTRSRTTRRQRSTSEIEVGQRNASKSVRSATPTRERLESTGADPRQPPTTSGGMKAIALQRLTGCLGCTIEHKGCSGEVIERTHWPGGAADEVGASEGGPTTKTRVCIPLPGNTGLEA